MVEPEPRFDNDPLSGAATASFSIGSRTLVAVSDGFFQMPRTFLGTVEHPAAGHEALTNVYGQSRLSARLLLLSRDRERPGGHRFRTCR